MATYTCYECSCSREYEDDSAARDDEWDFIDNQWVCEDCWSNCNECGEHTRHECGSWVDDTFVCESCFTDTAFWCERCEENYWNEDEREVREYRSDGSYVTVYMCRSCAGRENATYYEDLGCLVINDEYMPEGATMRTYKPDFDQTISTYCLDCQEYSEGHCPKCTAKLAKKMLDEETNLWVYDDGVGCYHDSDHNKFKRLKYRFPHEKPYLYYGIEVEMLFDSNESKNKIVQDFIQATNGLFVCEEDSSVSSLGKGAEFISRPLSYDKWMSDEVKNLLLKGQEVFDKYKAFENDRCGLHVHMSLKFFERNTTKDTSTIKSDMDWIFQVFQPEIEKISRRDYYHYCNSKKNKLQEQIGDYSFLRGIKGVLEISKGELAGDGCMADHTNAVMKSGATIEIRTFKTTKTLMNILPTIEFCRAVAHATRNMTLTKETTLRDIVFCKDSQYLEKYLKDQKVDLDKTFDETVLVELK